MGNRVGSLAERVRGQLRAGGALTAAEISIGLGMEGRDGAAKIRMTLRDFIRAGTAQRVRGDDPKGPVRYVLVNRPTEPAAFERMWSAIRSLRRFSVDDLEQLSGAARSYVREYLNGLLDAGIIGKQGRPGSGYLLLKDLGPNAPQPKDMKHSYGNRGGGDASDTDSPPLPDFNFVVEGLPVATPQGVAAAFGPGDGAGTGTEIMDDPSTGAMAILEEAIGIIEAQGRHGSTEETARAVALVLRRVADQLDGAADEHS